MDDDDDGDDDAFDDGCRSVHQRVTHFLSSSFAITQCANQWIL